MKKLLPIGVFLILAFVAFTFTSEKEQNISTSNVTSNKLKTSKKTPEQRTLFAEERARYEYKLQANPATGLIPLEEKELEFNNSKKAKIRFDGGDNLRAPDASFINRGPSNLGGRTRTIVPHRTNPNIILAGGVSGGVFRSTDSGASWTKVSANDEIHNVTAIVQDPRLGFEDTWYYATGELKGNSASIGADVFNINSNSYLGRGVWKSTDGGITWSNLGTRGGSQEVFDDTFDYISNLAVDPTTGYLFAATVGRIYFYLPNDTDHPPNLTGWYFLDGVTSCCSTTQMTDIAITSTGIIYYSIGGGGPNAGVYSTTDAKIWNGTPATKISSGIFTPPDRIVLGLAPSNTNKVYAIYNNGTSSDCSGIAAPEADLKMWDQAAAAGVGAWTDYSNKMPDESGCSNGNDPFAVQGGYNLTVSVKPNDEDFVVIGGVNAYRITDIVNDATFDRIGGYANTSGYSQYANHHPDVHALVFNPHNNNELFSGTDGGIHKTSNINAGTVAWTSLNNNYQTQQYYHVAIDPLSGSDFVLGGLQDNGTNQGGLSAGQSNLTEQQNIFSGDGVAVAISRDNVNIPTFVGTQYGSIYRRNKNLGSGFINANIKPTGTPDGISSPRAEFVTYFYLDQDNNNVLYYAANEDLYRTNDASNSTSTVGTGTSDWNNLGTPTSFGSQSIRRLTSTWGTYNAATSYLLIGGEAGKVVRLDDPHNATLASSGIDITPSGATGYVSDIAIHPTNRDIVLLTYSNYGVTNIYITTDATAASPTWYNAELNLSSHSIRSAAITTNTAGEALYVVGTARGLYSSTNPIGAPLGGSTVNWTREAPNLIGYAVVSSMSYRPADNKLLIGTHGNGMFEATINHVLGLEDNEFSESIKVYPNPVKNTLNLNISNELSKDATFIINNVLGQNVMEGTIENNQVNVNNLNTGIYFIQISSNGKKGVKRFIKK
ncbi:T9SS type A sorting domain-containing protein [Pontimicrobium aquaticum]|uniref:T9SS type A sorting domain-containing protein n=1 Tax=Pontimicrobium aquaticum TaxID=2565367 RepID=A0A4U0EY61_9FLAO|nr:T9SS type A sorting domain-containing protein [Pontimicrobium aquaticum]TJY36933.1 T9SS type A sorting domain-containing protein [Pontimicrobium aquaticum]